MANDNRNLLNQRLAAGHNLIQQGLPAKAIEMLLPLMDTDTKSPELTHLVALAYKEMQDPNKAEHYFLESLSFNEAQPQVHNNLANFYKTFLRYELADQHYRSAIALQPKFTDALRNYAISLADQQRFGTAIEQFNAAIEVDSQSASLFSGLGDCYRQSGNYIKAEDCYQRALSLQEAHLNALHNLGLNYHLQGELEKALVFYQKAYQSSPRTSAVLQSFALATHERGDIDEAINLFRKHLEHHPEDITVHERFNEILWESQYADQFCHSYQRAIKQAPGNLPLRVSYVAQLFRAGNIKAATRAVKQAIEIFNESPELLSLYGQIQAEEGGYQAATESFQASLGHQFSKVTAQQMVKLLIIQQDYLAAQLLLDQLMSHDESCQLTWALQSLVWRLSKDERYYWLNDYEQFVKSYMIPTPAGYGDLDEFLLAVDKVLNNQHKTERAPLQQTLRNGTQTAARLLHQPIPVLQTLKASLNNIVQEYVNALPNDAQHPFLSRIQASFTFSGSWSVKLKPGGYHVNHVHPAGWISSSCYISIPSSMKQDNASGEGAIKFGESPLSLGDREVIEMTKQPKAGMVVLFPSYMWHGTYAFNGAPDEYRMTAPFDIIPINKDML